ncbi:MAG: hypothetical protein BRD55_06455 [Bacteroidetes bacterium SW_9_63_38]|nr:MAG: hypothetical protein BRD55_06455 [Bacteroidetes bacterium SW_9_63_38]
MGEGGSAALRTTCRVERATHPILAWRWKAGEIVPGANVDDRTRNDAPTRAIVSFDYDSLSLRHRLKIVVLRAMGVDIVPRRALVYLWTNQSKDYDVTANPFFPWMRQIPVRSGTTDVGTWQVERQNVRRNYRTYFGGNPPPVDGIGIMTDTNDLNASLTTYFGDIVFRTVTNADSMARRSVEGDSP